VGGGVCLAHDGASATTSRRVVTNAKMTATIPTHPPMTIDAGKMIARHRRQNAPVLNR
jgi:hypothetical protein